MIVVGVLSSFLDRNNAIGFNTIPNSKQNRLFMFYRNDSYCIVDTICMAKYIILWNISMFILGLVSSPSEQRVGAIHYGNYRMSSLN